MRSRTACARRAAQYVMEAEKLGHSEDVCTYVKSDLGMMAKGNLAPNGKPFPDPDLLLLSYTGCFTFMKWFELLREQYKCETIMLHTPYEGDGKITDNMREYMVKQLKEEVIPKLGKGKRRQIRHRPLARKPQSGRPRPKTTWSTCCRQPRTSHRRSTPISAASTISDRFSARSAAPTMPSTITRPCARRSRTGSTMAAAR